MEDEAFITLQQSMRGTQSASHSLCPCCMLSLMFPPLVSPFCLVEINHNLQSKFQTTYLTLFRLLRHRKSELLITASRRTDISRQVFGETHDGNSSAHVETNRSNPAWERTAAESGFRLKSHQRSSVSYCTDNSAAFMTEHLKCGTFHCVSTGGDMAKTSVPLNTPQLPA